MMMNLIKIKIKIYDKPLRRITKYKLLLNELKRYCADDERFAVSTLTKINSAQKNRINFFNEIIFKSFAIHLHSNLLCADKF